MSSISTAAGQREDKQATLPTLAFAAGLASVFCTLGLLAASMGGIFGSFQGLTNVVVSVLSSGICLAMGLQLLDFIELPLPKLDVMQQHEQKSLIVNNTPQLLELDENGKLFLQPPPQKQRKQRQQEDGSLLQTFLLGGSSALVSSPCATPVLTSILAFVSNTHNPVVGAGLLLGYTLGYSTPLLLVASTGGQILAQTSSNSAYSKIAPWITPATGGILLWYGTNGILTAIFGDPSMVGLAPILE
jgi:cytochrome c-type biogenesis protein